MHSLLIVTSLVSTCIAPCIVSFMSRIDESEMDFEDGETA
jgi:hypothetical protein